MEVKKWTKSSDSLQKTVLGWKTIENLGRDISAMQTIVVEECIEDDEIRSAYQAQIKANQTLQVAMTYQVSEMGYN